MTPRSIRIEGQLAYIPLTKGYEALIDAADASLVEGWNWCADVNRRTVYALRTDFSEGRKRTLRLHRVIAGAPEGVFVDHIDGNGLNNRRANLRLVNAVQNARNQALRANNTSGYKGVSWDKRSRKWTAKIKSNFSLKNLGYFETPEAAHAAYCKASAELHGPFGRVA